MYIRRSGGGGAELFTYPYPLKVQARQSLDQRLATQSRDSGRYDDRLCFRSCIHLRFKHAFLGTHFSYLRYLRQCSTNCLATSERESGVLTVSIDSLKKIKKSSLWVGTSTKIRTQCLPILSPMTVKDGYFSTELWGGTGTETRTQYLPAYDHNYSA